MRAQINRYIELASPQILDDKWRELSFDLASGHNILQDCVTPESGSGYVYREAKSVGSATHNRFIYWRTTNDVLELIEISTEVNLEDNQVRIRFVDSPIVNNIYVIEFSESIAIVLVTKTSVHRIFLPHPKTTSRSVFSSLTSDVLFDPANYYLLGNQSSSGSNHPICASSWYDKSTLSCALSFPDSSILIVQFGHKTPSINTFEIKQTGIIGRLWSKMPNLWAKSPDECDNAIFASVPFHHYATNDVLLITLCRDCRIRIFSIETKECVCSFNMIPQSSFHQSFAAHSNPSTETPLIRMIGSYIVVYLSENKPEFVFLEHSYSDNVHELKECVTLQAPDWNKLLDFGVTKQKIWALANMCETESALCYMDLKTIVDQANIDVSIIEGSWEFVNLSDLTEPQSSKSLVAEIFWRNNFSVSTVQKALIGIAGPSVPKKGNMEALEEVALTRIINDDQDSAWRRFHEYCLQNHLSANKCIGLVLSEDESVIGIVKRSNPSFVCPWLVNIDMVLQEGPYRGMEFSQDTFSLVDSLNYISTELLSEDHSSLIEDNLIENPSEISTTLNDVAKIIASCQTSWPSALKMNKFNKMKTLAGVDCICNELDLTAGASEFNEKILSEYTSKMKSEHNPLGSNSGIFVTFELFRRLVKARMILARDLLIYVNLLSSDSEAGEVIADFCEELYTSGRIRRLLNSLRSYATLAFIADSPIKGHSPKINVDVINHLAKYFQFFKSARHAITVPNTKLEQILHQNALTYFLFDGGINFHWLLSQLTIDQQSLSSSYYVTETVLNLCKLLWPQSNHLCLPEFLFTHQFDEHLTKYLNIVQNWVECCDPDRHFLRACNCLLQKRASQAVEIFNRLWPEVTNTNLIGRFLEFGPSDRLEKVSADFELINRYYAKLIQLFQAYNDRQCLVMLINNCMSLLESSVDGDQTQSMNSLRAKLFQYYLELEDPDEAYHTMVLTTDPSLRINCLRKFIVSHCEKEQWINLLSYPFIDIKHDFIDILNQKAESIDLSSLDTRYFYRTSYYDLLFASHVMDEDYRHAAECMYNYSQRLAQEIPGITSIRKQVDCLLIALNSLRCVEGKDQYIECRRANLTCNGRTSILKRSHDCESNHSSPHGSINENVTTSQNDMKVYCRDIERNYELTKARLKLLEKDETANAIALSPLTPEETINQLVASSLFSTAMDLALSFRASMEAILEGLAAKYILVMRLSSADIAVYQDVERGISDLFMSSYSNIETYNYVANSTSPLFDRLWRLIDYYLRTYDGVSHRYRSSYIAENSAPTTVLMRVVANKLLSAGYNVPASLRRLYMLRNPSELLKLMLKYDKLFEATELSIEMIDRILEPSNCVAMVAPNSTTDRLLVYLPTHLILLLITFLSDDATDTTQLKMASALSDRLDKFRSFVKAN